MDKLYIIKTDDQRFEFQFDLHQGKDSLVESVDARIFYIDKENNFFRKLKFEKLNIRNDEIIVFEIRDIELYTICGNAALKIIKSCDGTFAGMESHYYYGDKQNPREFEGLLFYTPINP